MVCPEEDRSWCSSSSANDHRAITIEVASDSKAPYAVTDAAYASLIDLLVDICKRNGIPKLLWKADKSLIGQVDKQNMTVHRWFANKSCPGEYLYSRHGQIADEVNKRLAASTIQGDVNGDEKVDTADITALLTILSDTTTDPKPASADVNRDGIVNTADLTMLQNMLKAAEKQLYRVQVGAYLVSKNAETMLAKVKAADPSFKDAFITKDGLLHRVQIGAYSLKSNAEKMQKKLKDKGFNAIIKIVTVKA